MRLCRCGYLDEDDIYDLRSKKREVYGFNSGTNANASGRVGKENKEQINSSIDGTKKIFDIAGRKRGYVFYVSLIFVAITFARGTVDGLIFFAILAMIFAKRIENYRKYGEPIIADKDTRQSIWKYGLSKTGSSTFQMDFKIEPARACYHIDHSNKGFIVSIASCTISSCLKETVESLKTSICIS